MPAAWLELALALPPGTAVASPVCQSPSEEGGCGRLARCGGPDGRGAVQQRGRACPRQDAGSRALPPSLLRNKSHTGLTSVMRCTCI